MIRASTLLAAGLLALGCGRSEPARVALIGATVVDGTGAAPITDAVVLVHGATIEAVGTREQIGELPRGTREVDVSGRWIVPGLIDADARATPWALGRYLAFGITAIRDVHGPIDSVLDLATQVNLGAVSGPRVFSGGAMIDGNPPTDPEALGVESGPEARRAVDRLSVLGARFFTAGPRISPSLLQAITDEAAIFDLPVTAHLGLTDALSAAGMGVRSMAHLSGIPEALRSPQASAAAHRAGYYAGWGFAARAWATLDSAGLARVAAQLRDSGVVLVPTLALHERYGSLDQPEDRADRDVLPAAERARWSAADLLARTGWTPRDLAIYRRGRAMQDLFVREYHRVGGVVVAGSHAPRELMVPGSSLHEELALLVGAGLSPTEVLIAATAHAAALLQADSLGQIAPGKVADLVILARDPLENIKNTRSAEAVMVRGRILPVDSLRRAW